MTTTRIFNEKGLTYFRNWLQAKPVGCFSPEALMSEEFTEPLEGHEIDLSIGLSRQFEFAKYLTHVLSRFSYSELMAEKYDGLWAWLSAAFYHLLAGKKPKREEHYLVVRKGPMGSLAYRNDARTAFLLFSVHGDFSLLCLDKRMDVWGELSEQLTSRQRLMLSKAYFRAGTVLYVRDGKVKRGIATKPKPADTRPFGDKAGRGGARRLAVALDRLQLTYDVEMMSGQQILEILPKEFRVSN